MAFDPFDDETVRRSLIAHQVGQDLSELSVEEIDERIAMLEKEIARLIEDKLKKEAVRQAASKFFKS